MQALAYVKHASNFTVLGNFVAKNAASGCRVQQYLKLEVLFSDVTFSCLPANRSRICNPESHELRTVETLPDDRRLVRLHIGLEHAPDLWADLAQAFDQMG